MPLCALATELADPPPWLSPYLAVARRVVDARTQSIADALNAARTSADGAVTFVDHSVLPPGEAYESFIFRTGQVPTRDTLHDLFNGIVWLQFPQTKRRLNALQAAHIARHGTLGPRGALRDALTLFDENAALLQAPSTLVSALRARDWRSAFGSLRTEWNEASLVLFGHALIEKLMQPRKPITAHVWVVASLDDASIAASIEPDAFTTRDFMPLPVLGVPGWWPANEQSGFYDDPKVFREPRAGRPTGQLAAGNWPDPDPISGQ